MRNTALGHVGIIFFVPTLMLLSNFLCPDFSIDLIAVLFLLRIHFWCVTVRLRSEVD